MNTKLYLYVCYPPHCSGGINFDFVPDCEHKALPLPLFSSVLLQVKVSGPAVPDPEHLHLYNVTMDDATRYSCIVIDKMYDGNFIYHYLNVLPGNDKRGRGLGEWGRRIFGGGGGGRECCVVEILSMS